MNYGKLFWGTVLPFSVILLIISILAMTDMFGEGNGLSLAGALFSLFGGLAGGLSAYFIAREQIRHQESSKIMDVKLSKLENINTSLADIIQDLVDLKKEIDDNFHFEYDMEELNNLFFTLRQAKGDKIKKNLLHIYQLKVYFKMMGLNPKETMDILEKHSLGFVFIEDYDFWRIEQYQHIPNILSHNIKTISDIQEKVEKEIENIILK